MTNSNYLLALNQLQLISPDKILRLLNHWPQLEELFATPSSQLESLGIPERVAIAISSYDMALVDKELDYCDKHRCQVLSWFDKEYPSLLREIANPPMILYALGDTRLLHHANLAMVGSRKPTPLGKQLAFQFAQELSGYDLNIVSGLAIGIDTQCHRGALASSGKTIAVMATGIDEIYPRRNRQLADSIKEKGLIITESPLKTPPTPRQFPRRNRIISGLSLGTMVIEAAIKSGSLITAQLAIEQNREVFALPGTINNPQSQGCHQLVQQGARLVTKVEDVLMELAIPLRNLLAEDKKIGKPLAKNLQNLVKCVNYEVTTVDEIIDFSGLLIEDLLSELVKLELLGLICQVPGGYMRC